MNDMSQVITPKSDQLSADDFLAGPRTFTIESVEIRPGTEQPVSIFMQGEDRPWKSCKSMSRVLVAAWGPDAKTYEGRSVTLYRDPTVKWGGLAVGGIRVSHMSHIEREMLLQLTATKGKRAPHIVKPLIEQERQAPKTQGKQTPQEWVDQHLDAIDSAITTEALDLIEKSGVRAMTKLAAEHADLHAEVVHAYSARRAALAMEGKPDADMGDGFGDDEGEEG